MNRNALRSVIAALIAVVCITLWRGGTAESAVDGKAVKIVAGDDQSLAIRTDGILWGWGRNTFKDSSKTAYLYPVQGCDFGGPIIDVAGQREGVALKADGTVWEWGKIPMSSYPFCRKVAGLSGVKEVAASWTDLMALKADGTVWLWQIASGWGATPKVPVEVTGMPAIEHVAMESGLVAALTADGSVYTWKKSDPFAKPALVSGISDVTALGIDYYEVYALRRDGTIWHWSHIGYYPTWPEQVPGITDVRQMSVNRNLSAAVKQDGSVWYWGSINSRYGSVARPTKIEELTDIADVSAGPRHLLARSADGTVWAVGDGGTLGIGDDHNPPTEPVKVLPLRPDTAAPTWVDGRLEAELTYTSMKLTWSGDTDDSLVVGYNLYRNNVLERAALDKWAMPVTLSAAPDTEYNLRVEAIDPTGNISSNGPTLTVRTPPDTFPPVWYNKTLTVSNVGQTGLTLTWKPASEGYGSVKYRIYSDGQMIRELPSLGRSTYEEDITGLTPGTTYAIAVQAIDNAGNESTDGPAATVTMLPVRNEGAVVGIGSNHGLVASVNGEVLAWGSNYNKQVIPSGNPGVYDEPSAVQHLTDITAVAGGDRHSLALTGDGRVWSWGDNTTWQLGRGTPASLNVPGTVLDLTGVRAIAAGAYHSLALKADGTVWAWGSNTYKQLGDGSTTDRWRPVQVQGLTGVKNVAAGAFFSLALKDDGTVWMWGAMKPGQTGAPNLAAPTRVGTIANVTGIAAGGYHALAVTGDGSVWAWGTGDRGQIGDNGTSNRWNPVRITALSDVKSVGTGGLHSLAVKNDGSLWTWGDNTYGQLGDGTTGNMRKTPYKVNVSPIATVASGIGFFSLAVDTHDIAWAWGTNQLGELGELRVHESLAATPVQVRLPWADLTGPTWPEGTAVTISDVKETQLTVSWTPAEDNVGVSTYWILRDDVRIASVPGNQTSYTVTGLQGKTSYRFKIEAGDAADNRSFFSPEVTATTIGVDRLAPTLALDAQGKPKLYLAVYKNEAWQFIAAKSATTKGISFESGQAAAYALVGEFSEAIERITVSGVTASPAIAGASFTLPFTPTGNGTVTIRLEAYDPAGNKVVLPPVTVTVPVGPTVTISDPANSAFVGTNGTLLVKGSTNKAITGMVIYNVDQPDEVFSGELTLKSGNKFEALVAFPTDVNRTVKIRIAARDAAGLWSLPTTGGTDTRTITIDVTPPVNPTVEAPVPQESILRFTAANITLRGKAEPFSTITASEFGPRPVTATADKNGAYTLNLTGIAEGQSELILIARDAAQNNSPGIRLTLWRDSRAPVLAKVTTSLDNANGHVVTESTGTSLRVQAAEQYTVRVTFNEEITNAKVNGASVGITRPSPDSLEVTLALPPPKRGISSLPVSVTDLFGNTTTLTLNITADGEKPGLTLTTPSSLTVGANPYAFTGTSTEPLKTITAVDPATGEPLDLDATVAFDARTPTKWTVTIRFPDEQRTWSLRFAGTDLAGNPSSAGSRDTAVVTVDPGRPVLTVFGAEVTPDADAAVIYTDGNDPDLQITNKKLTVTGSVTDTGSGVKKVAVNAATLTPSQPDGTFDFTSAVTLQESALTTVTVTAEDKAGNQSYLYRTYVVMKSAIGTLKLSKPSVSKQTVTLSGSTDKAISVPGEPKVVVPVTIVVTGKVTGEVYRTTLTDGSAGYTTATGAFQVRLTGLAKDAYTVTVTAAAPDEFPDLASKSATATFTIK